MKYRLLKRALKFARTPSAGEESVMSFCKNCGGARESGDQLCRSCGAVQTYYQPAMTAGLDREEWNTQIVGLMGRPGEANDPGQPSAQQLFGVSSDRFEMIKTLGMGAVGMVYLARDKESDELVALKVLRPGLRKNKEIIARFRREIQIANKLDHPNIARVHSFNENGGGMYIVMQFIDGTDLAEYQRSHVLSKPINLGELMNLVQRYSSGVLVPRAER